MKVPRPLAFVLAGLVLCLVVCMSGSALLADLPAPDYPPSGGSPASHVAEDTTA